jgi:hypothetical protein
MAKDGTHFFNTLPCAIGQFFGEYHKVLHFFAKYAIFYYPSQLPAL